MRATIAGSGSRRTSTSASSAASAVLRRVGMLETETSQRETVRGLDRRVGGVPPAHEEGNRCKEGRSTGGGQSTCALHRGILAKWQYRTT